MAYATEKNKVGRKPSNIAQLKLDYCSLSYGVTPCSVGRVFSGATPQAGSTASTIVLAASSSSIDNTYNKFAVVIISGTGAGQERRITAYNGSTKVATIYPNWDTTPDITSRYSLINRPAACYNTRATCQDSVNYTPDTTINNYWFVTESADFPSNIWEASGLGAAIPCLISIQTAPSKITLGQGLGTRASLTIKLRDFPHHDRGTDKYVYSRNYTPENQGTFFGKFMARNRYYQGRDIVIHSGYIDSNGYDAGNFLTREFIIEKISGPDKNHEVTITAKDVLKLAEDDRALVPAPCDGTLAEDIDETQTGVVSIVATDLTNYRPVNGYARIGDEIVHYTAIAYDSISIDARGAKGTTADQHSIDDAIQYCIDFDAVNVVDIIRQLLDSAYRVTAGLAKNAGIDASKLDLSGWADEKESWLNNNTLSNIISEPTGVKTLLNELLTQNLMYLWWDEDDKLVKIKAISPQDPTDELTDNLNFLADSVEVTDDPQQRISEVWVWWGRLDPTDKKRKNFSNLYIQADVLSEATDQYNDIRVKEIQSDWIADEALAIQIAGRTLALLKDNPRVFKFQLDAKDTIRTGDYYNLNTQHLQQADGSNQALLTVILQSREIQPGSTWEYMAQEFSFIGRYGYIGYSHEGRAQAGTADTITLAADASGINNIYRDHIITILSGTGAGQTRQIFAYDGTTKIVHVYDPWSPAPDSTSVYFLTLPDYSIDGILKEDGSNLLKEDGTFLLVESATGRFAANDYLKTKYAWIAPDSGYFGDGTEAYKII